MLRKMLVVLALGPAALAGCGGDDGGGGSGGGGGGGSSDNPNIEAAVASCKQAVQSAPQLKKDTVADLEKICEKAGSGDIEDAQKAAKEVCVKIVEDSVPEGQARDQAKTACEQAAP